MTYAKGSFEILVLAQLISGPVSCTGGPARCAPPIEQPSKMTSAWATDKHCLAELRNNRKEQWWAAEVRGGWQVHLSTLHPFSSYQSTMNFPQEAEDAEEEEDREAEEEPRELSLIPLI